MFLADVDIRQAIEKEQIKIVPYERKYIRPSSICLRLGYDIIEFKSNIDGSPVDLKDEKSFPSHQTKTIDKEKGFVLSPHTMVLANTLEKISVSRTFAAWISGLSGLARLGLQIALSNLVSPGYGELSPSSLTLEIVNFSPYPIKLYSEMRVCHLIFVKMSNISESGYDALVGTYSNQDAPRVSNFYNEFKKSK